VDAAASGASEGASAAVRAGAHIGHQLYTQGVSALAQGASAATGAATDLGDGPFGRALKQLWRPPSHLAQSFEDIHEFHQGMVQQLGDAVDTSIDHYLPRFKAALQGEAGDALVAAHHANTSLWSKHQDMHDSAGTAAAQALVHIKGLQGRIDNLAEAGEEEFNKALRNRDPITAMQVWTQYNTHAEESTTEATQKATSAIRAAKFTIPLTKEPEDPPPHEEKKEGEKAPQKATPKTDDTGAETPAQGDPGAQTPNGGDPAPGTPTGLTNGQGPAGPAQGTPTGLTNGLGPGGPAPGTATGLTNGQGGPGSLPTAINPQALSGVMGRAASAGGGGSGAGGGGSALSGLGSGLNPGSGLGSGLNPGSGLGSGMPTSPASSMPSAPTAPPPVANPGSSFQSGLASGMGAVAPPPVADQSIAPQQAVAAQQPLMGSAAGSGPAGVPIAPHGVTDAGGGGPVQGGSGSVGGAPMMPPAAMAGGGPLAPYSAPGAGAAPTGGGAPTTPASGGQASSGGAAPAGGSGLSAPGPVLAGGSGAGGAMGGMAASTSDVSADMLLAQRVLAGLVRGCEFWPAPIAWAVGVVKTPVGSQVVIANSVGGGSYLPSTVFVPSTARLAVVDPALPFGWAHRWMGCQKPSKILVDHFEQLSKRVAGASISAMVTTELWPAEPAGVGEFLGMQHRQALGMLSTAPVLDGAHQHRLTALDPVLAQRVSALASNPQVAVRAAAGLTAAVIRAAHAPDGTGKPLAFEDEANILQAVSAGTADEALWASYDAQVAERDERAWLFPESHAALDHDGSELSESMNLWYRHYFQGGRVVEMVQWWKNGVAPLAEVAYCGLQAGFGPVVAATIGAIEEQLSRAGGPRP
jgi:hypothetical protein